MTKDLEKLLTQLHSEITKDLLSRVKSGEATAAELTAAIKFLRDNGIDAHLTQDSPLTNLASSLPFQDPESPIRSAG
jgi:hypothetical protein